jgi:hypothetical protein
LLKRVLLKPESGDEEADAPGHDEEQHTYQKTQELLNAFLFIEVIL